MSANQRPESIPSMSLKACQSVCLYVVPLMNLENIFLGLSLPLPKLDTKKYFQEQNFYIRHLTYDTWNVTCDMWHWTCYVWHVMCDMGNVTHGGRGVRISLKLRVPTLTIWEWRCFEDVEEKDKSLGLMNWLRPGLLNT